MANASAEQRALASLDSARVFSICDSPARKRERGSIQDFNPRAAVGRKLPLDAVDGQAWQKQTEDTPPVR
jgi:hypothetical protein